MSNRPRPSHSKVDGTVIELFLDDDYGYILTEDQREVRFHPSDTRDKSFAGLRVGTPVRLLALETARELRAEDIEPLGPHAPRKDGDE